MANLNFEELLVSLNNAGIAASQPALYQAIKNIINKNTQFQKTYNTEQALLEQKLNNVLMFGTEADRAKFKPQVTIGNILLFYATDTGVLWVFDPSQNDWFPVGAPIDATYITWTDESARLPNSRNLVAGDGIQFDDTVPNVRTISTTGGDGLIPMCTGEYPAEIMTVGYSVMMIPYSGT